MLCKNAHVDGWKSRIPLWDGAEQWDRVEALCVTSEEPGWVSEGDVSEFTPEIKTRQKAVWLDSQAQVVDLRSWKCPSFCQKKYLRHPRSWFCMWHYLGTAGCHRTSGTPASLSHLRNQAQETSYSLSNHFKMNTNRTNAAQSQEPRHVSLHCILLYCPYSCSLWPTWYKIVRSFKGVLVGLATLHPCTMGFEKKLFKKKLAGFGAVSC